MTKYPWFKVLSNVRKFSTCSSLFSLQFNLNNHINKGFVGSVGGWSRSANSNLPCLQSQNLHLTSNRVKSIDARINDLIDLENTLYTRAEIYNLINFKVDMRREEDNVLE
jgi:hypothetical protein